jgi:hypothetical protein
VYVDATNGVKRVPGAIPPPDGFAADTAPEVGEAAALAVGDAAGAEFPAPVQAAVAETTVSATVAVTVRKAAERGIGTPFGREEW